jgi:hypothetical protein
VPDTMLPRLCGLVDGRSQRPARSGFPAFDPAYAFLLTAWSRPRHTDGAGGRFSPGVT